LVVGLIVVPEKPASALEVGAPQADFSVGRPEGGGEIEHAWEDEGVPALHPRVVEVLEQPEQEQAFVATQLGSGHDSLL
jgi:hypothetical protein